MPIGISPLVDFAFKLMLASRGHERVTIHFLNAILGEQVRIVSIEIENPYVGPNFEGDKWVVLDILATDERGRKFNIEMQTSIPPGLRQRLAFYDARLYVEQLRQGDQYHELLPAIVICVLDKPLLTDCDNLHTDFRLRDEFGRAFTDDLQIHVLELTKLTATRENLQLATAADRWAYFLLNAENLTVAEIREMFPEPEFAEAAGVLEMIKDNPDQMSDYISRLKYKLDEGWRIESTRAEALKEGREEGIKEGKKEGIKEGIKEGRNVGLKEGELIGQIVILQELLGLTEPGREDLSNYDTIQLNDLCSQLRLQLRSRQSS